MCLRSVPLQAGNRASHVEHKPSKELFEVGERVAMFCRLTSRVLGAGGA